MSEDKKPYTRQSDIQLKAIEERLNAGDIRFGHLERAVAENTAITQQVADSMAGFVAFSDDLAAGTRIMCRVAKGIEFAQEKVVKPLWKPAVAVYLIVYFVRNDGTLPDWAYKFLTVIGF